MNGAEVITLKEYFLKLLTEMEERNIIRFDSMERALVLARNLAQADKDLARNILEHRLIGMDEFQKRVDRLEGTFVTQDMLKQSIGELIQRVTYIEKIMYIGMGVLCAVQCVLKFGIK